MDVSALLERLRAVASVTPEYEGADVFSAIQEKYAELLDQYPAVARFSDYLSMLRATGGLYVENKEFDLGLYGFSGYIVTAFHQANFLDRDRFFVFGEVLYPGPPQRTVFLAFDTRSERDEVYCADGEDGEYIRCADSFKDLLIGFAEGGYPYCQGAS